LHTSKNKELATPDNVRIVLVLLNLLCLSLIGPGVKKKKKSSPSVPGKSFLSSCGGPKPSAVPAGITVFSILSKSTCRAATGCLHPLVTRLLLVPYEPLLSGHDHCRPEG
jgi:hypothetical protein